MKNKPHADANTLDFLMGTSSTGFRLAAVAAPNADYLYVLEDTVLKKTLVAGPDDIDPRMEQAFLRQGMLYVVKEAAAEAVDEFLDDCLYGRGGSPLWIEDCREKLAKAFAVVSGTNDAQFPSLGAAMASPLTSTPAIHDPIEKDPTLASAFAQACNRRCGAPMPAVPKTPNGGPTM